jgi:LysM repeat protein
VTHVPAARIADQARNHLGEAGPVDTCVSNGMRRWTRELGLPDIGTDSVSEAVRLAKQGHNGWRYHDGTDGLARGNFGVWTHAALGSTNSEHVCVVDDVNGGVWRGIGSGTPSRVVSRQPASGGYNPKTVLRGYLIAPTETTQIVKPAAVIKPAPSKNDPGTYTIRRGDTLIKIAARHHTTWQKLMAANPPAKTGSADFHIVRANLIYAGQKIRIP